MLAESFSRYLRDFRKPYGKKRTEIIKKLNMKKQYNQVSCGRADNNPMKVKMLRAMKTQLPSDKAEVVSGFEKPESMQKLKGRLDNLNGKAEDMFEHIK